MLCKVRTRAQSREIINVTNNYTMIKVALHYNVYPIIT